MNIPEAYKTTGCCFICVKRDLCKEVCRFYPTAKKNHNGSTILSAVCPKERIGCERCQFFLQEPEEAKTIKNCAGCPKLTKCDAHISGGQYKHREGPEPCTVRGVGYPGAGS